MYRDFELARPPLPEWHIPFDLSTLAPYARPTFTPDEEAAVLRRFEERVPQRFERALVVGRFQPIHYGHILLIKHAALIADTVIIGIGSANVRDMKNPWSPQERKMLMEHHLEQEAGLKDSVEGVVFVNDYMNDALWFDEAVRRAGEVDAVVGNNDWVNRIFVENGIPAITTPEYDRGRQEASKIRAFLRGNQ
jgi:nicotinamide-nucleotide adenylyltransferase